MSNLVCPECGNDEFEATLTTRTEYTYSVHEYGGAYEVAENVVDGGDLGDVDEFKCNECGAEYSELDDDALVTREQYDALPDDQEGW